jgi:histidinol-phosphate aminotransferase
MDKQFWAGRIQSIVPYVAGEQPKDKQYIKLNTNENPYPPSPRAMEALRAAATPDLRLYPDPDCAPLKAALSKVYGVPESHIFVGNGSDEVLAFCFAAFTDADTAAVFPDLTYSFYPVYAELFASKTRIVPVRDDFSIPLEELCHNDGTVVLTNPNAPTSLAVSRAEIERVLRANPDHVVIVDEAYVDFGAESALPLLGQYDNLLIVQTMSKSRSFAGLRVGYAFGSESLIAALDAVKNSFNSYTIDRAAMLAATAAVEDTEYFADVCKKISATRDDVIVRLRALGFLVPESKSNFVFVRHPAHSGEALFRALRERGILVRWWGKPRIADYLRITIGTPEEMDALVNALRELTEG